MSASPASGAMFPPPPEASPRPTGYSLSPEAFVSLLPCDGVGLDAPPLFQSDAFPPLCRSVPPSRRPSPPLTNSLRSDSLSAPPKSQNPTQTLLPLNLDEVLPGSEDPPASTVLAADVIPGLVTSSQTVVPPVSSSPNAWGSVSSSARVNSRPLPQNVVFSDGKITSDVPDDLINNRKPLWDHIIVGHFIGENAPHIGSVHAIVNRLWPTTLSPCKIDAQFIATKSVLFRISNDKIRNEVLKQRFWYISEVPMVVQAWNPTAAVSKPDMSAIPMWVDFKSVPDSMFHGPGLLYLGDIIGGPDAGIKLHPNTLRCTRLDRARVLVKMNLNKQLPVSITLNAWPDSPIQVTYPWLPPYCHACFTWGHNSKECSTLKGMAPNVTPQGDNLTHSVTTTAQIPLAGRRIPEKIWVPKSVQGLPSSSSPTHIENEVCSMIPTAEIVQLHVPSTSHTPVLDSVNANLPIASPAKSLEIVEDTVLESMQDVVVADVVAGCTSVVDGHMSSSSNEEGSLDEDDEIQATFEDSLDFCPSTGKRLLRERPVKPTEKVKEMQSQSKGSGRGKRGRGNRGRGNRGRAYR